RLATLDLDRVRVAEAAGALDPLDAVRLEEARDTAGHLLDDGVLPLVGSREVERGLADPDAELGEALLGLLQREGRLYPGLGRDAADAEAGAAELGLLLDADGLGAQLGRADRCGVAAGAASEDGDVAFHELLSSPSFGAILASVPRLPRHSGSGRFGPASARSGHRHVTVPPLVSKAGVRGRRPPGGKRFTRARGSLERRSAQVGLHRHAAVVAAHSGEAVALVQPDRGAVGLDTETDRVV